MNEVENAEEREALWELIGAINWIVEAWSKRELADAVRNASELAEAIAIKFPLEEFKP